MAEETTEATEVHPLTEEGTDEPTSGRYLAYPNSRLSPQIIPTDLSTFKSRGIGTVEKFFQQRLRELHEEYLDLVDRFNWNKLIYEAKFGFEPSIGVTYHLYELRAGYTLSMIAPEQWPGKKWVGSFRLNADGQWTPDGVADDFDLREFVGGEDQTDAA
ncbi:MAG: DUF2452 domain-containing protein [Verrucomicrobiota bacterium]